MNKEIELLNNKLDAQDKIINSQALEIARLKEQNKHIEQWWKETNVIIRNDKSLAINDNAMEYILDLEEEIARLKGKCEILEENNKLLIQQKQQMYEDLDIAYDKIDKAIDFINEHKHLSMFAYCREPEEDWIYDLEINANKLLEILGDKENE